MHYNRHPRSVQSRLLGFMVAVGFALLFASSPALAKDAQSYIQSAHGYAEKGNLKAAEIELRNAIKEAPQDPHIHARLADIYLTMGDAASAEREARSARDLNGDEADYLLTLAQAMLRQGKFAGVPVEIKQASRPPELESKLKVILAAAAAGLGDRGKAETLLRQAVATDPSASGPKLALARQLLGSKPDEAEGLADQVLSSDPRSAEAIVIKGNVLGMKGDADGALQRYDEALQIEPNNVDAHLSRARVNLSRGDYAAVDKELDPILKAAPKNFAANYFRALEHFKKREFAEADKILTQLSPAFGNMPEGLYVQAATKYALGQLAQAADTVAKYVARDPENAAGARLAAMVALRRQVPDESVRYLTAYLTKSKPDATTLALLGNSYLAAGNAALALEQYQKAASLEPDNPSLKTMVAASEIGSGAGEKGLEELEQVFASDAGAAVAGPTLVLTELRAGRVEKAAEAAEALAKRDGNNPLYQTLLGIVRAAQRDYPAAEAIFKSLAEKSPDFAPAWVNLAHAYFAAGNREEAKKTYQQLLSRKPNDVSALLGLADLAATEKHWDEAIQYAEKARAASPSSDPSSGLKLLNFYAAQQDWTKARALASELSAQFPSNFNVLDAQGRILVASGDRDRAIDVYRHAYEIAPNSGPILSGYLSVLASAKRFPDYRAVLQSRLEKDPSNRGIKAQLIGVEAEIGGLDAGLAKAQRFAKDDPQTSVYDIVSAELYEKNGKRSDAIALLQKAAAARPADDGIPIALSGLYGKAGDLSKAELVLEDYLKSRPDATVARVALADFYIKNNKFEAATTQELKIVSERPNDSTALNNLAWLYQQAGDLSKARELAEKAAAIAPTSGSISDTLGWILLAQGDTENALARLQAASNALPGNPDVRYHVAVALDRAGRANEARSMLEQLLSSGASFTSKADAEKLLDQLKRG